MSDNFGRQTANALALSGLSGITAIGRMQGIVSRSAHSYINQVGESGNYEDIWYEGEHYTGQRDNFGFIRTTSLSVFDVV